MKNISKKVNKLNKIINTCSPEEFFKFRFHDFSQDMIYSDGDPDSYYFEDDFFLFINEKVRNLGLSIEGNIGKIESDMFEYQENAEDSDGDGDGDGDGDEYESDSDSDSDDDDKDLYFTLGIYVFRCYIKHCLAVSKVSHPDMKKFCQHIEKEYFNDDFFKNVIEYYFYFKREGNREMEEEQVEFLANQYSFFVSLQNINFYYDIVNDKNEENDKEYVENISNYVNENYVCYLESIYLAFSNFLNFLNNLVLSEELGN